MGVDVYKCSHINKQILDTSRVSENSALLWSHLPRNGIRFHKPRAHSPRTNLHVRGQSQAQNVTYTSDWLTVKQRFSWPSPWVWVICYNSSQNSGNPFTQQMTNLLQKILKIISQWRDAEGKAPKKGLHGTWALAPGHILIETFWFTLPGSLLNYILLESHYIGLIT